MPVDALERAMEAVEPASSALPPYPGGPLHDPGRRAEGEPESEFITGPVLTRAPERAMAPGRRASESAMGVGARAGDEDEDDDAELIGGEGDDGDDDGVDDEELEEQEDALFELACAAVEQGDELGWQETAALLLTAEVTDPRLALVVGLLMEGAPEDEDAPKHTPLALTGGRVLSMMEALGLGELVEEAREVTELAPSDEEESAEERAVVRTNARALSELGKRELADGEKGERGRKDPGRPLRASDITARRTALSSGAVGKGTVRR